MADRILIKNAIVLTPGPERIGELPRADILVEGDRIADGRPEPVAPTAPRSSTPTGDIVIPGFVDTHRHTWETSIRTSRAGLHAGRLLRRDPRQVRAQLPAGGRPRGEPVGRPRVHQRGHHDARRLVAHHEHARPRRRRGQGPPGRRASGRCSRSASRTPRSRRGGSARTTPAASSGSTATRRAASASST